MDEQKQESRKTRHWHQSQQTSSDRSRPHRAATKVTTAWVSCCHGPQLTLWTPGVLKANQSGRGHGAEPLSSPGSARAVTEDWKGALQARESGRGGSLIPVPASCSLNCGHSTGSQSTKRTHRTGLGGVRGACCSPPSPQRAAPAVALAVQNRMVTEWAAEVQSQRARRRVPWSQKA